MPALYQTNHDIPDDMLLGNMLFFNLVDMTVTETDMLNALVNNNLPVKYCKRISKADAFRRATASIKNSSVTYTDESDVTFIGKINIDEVINDDTQIKRIMGVRVLNDKQEEVYYKQVASISFDRATNVCDFVLDSSIFNGHNDQDVDIYIRLLKTVKHRYSLWSTTHNHDTVKNTVNRIIYDMHPVALMPTGICRFIPSQYKDTLYGLKGFVEELSQFSNSGSKNVMELIPIVDTQEHRNLIKTSYKDELTESLYDYTQELAQIINSKSVLSDRQANTYLTKFKDLRDKVMDYQNLLGTYEQDIHDQIKAVFNIVMTHRKDSQNNQQDAKDDDNV